MIEPWSDQPDDIEYILSLPANQTQFGWDTLHAYKHNSFLVPSILSYVILGTAGLAVVLASLSPLFAKLNLPLRPIERFLIAPTIGKRYSQTLTIIPSIKRNRRGDVSDAWVSLHLPLRWETFVILALWIANIVGVTAFYTPSNPEENVYWPGTTTYPQMVRYVADRSAVLAQAQLVLIYLFAGRNSPVALATRGHITFETLMLFHRWIARVVVAQAFVHAMAYTTSALIYGGHADWLASFEPYWNWGVVAMTLLALLCGLSLRSLRNVGYETFVITHTIFAILTIVALYYHIGLLDYNGYDEYMNYLYTCIAFWVFERGVRLLRMAVLNINLLNGTSSQPTFFSTATLISTVPSTPLASPVSKLSKGSVIEDIPPLILRIFPVGPAATRSSVMSYLWAPGQHLYLSIPSIQPLTSHPFTVLSSGMVAPLLSSRNKRSDTASSIHDEKHDEKNDRSEESSVITVARPYIDLALVPRAGLTKSLAKRLGGTVGDKEMTVFVDGPYGPSLDLQSYSVIQLAAGGIGSTFTLPFFFDTIRRDTTRLALEHPDAEAQALRTPVHLVWAVKTIGSAAFALPYFEDAISSIRDSSAENFEACPYRMTIHTTHTRSSPDVASTLTGFETQIKSQYAGLAPYITVTWTEGRPALGDVFEASKGTIGVGRKCGKKMAVISCGPAGFVDDCRFAAAAADKKADDVRVDYFEESFTW